MSEVKQGRYRQREGPLGGTTQPYGIVNTERSVTSEGEGGGTYRVAI